MKASLFSVSYAGLCGQATLTLPAFIDHACKLGFSSVMLAGKRPHLSPLDASPKAIAAVRAALKKTRVRCDVIGAYTNLAQSTGAGGEVPLIELQIAYVESLARLAAQVGAGVVRIFTAYESERGDLQASWVRVVATVREMCDRAAAHGVTIAIQNHHDLALHTDALLELLVKADHHDTIRVSTRRVPMRSAHQAVGISNAA
jgi:sugar phosphate isomerase/epimerase